MHEASYLVLCALFHTSLHTLTAMSALNKKSIHRAVKDNHGNSIIKVNHELMKLDQNVHIQNYESTLAPI